MKNKRITVAFLVICGLAFICPLVFLVFNVNVSTITYESSCSGITIIGEAHQYGQISKESSEISVLVDYDFTFLGWSDGVQEKSRKDTFTQTKKVIYALGRYNNDDLDILEFNLKEPDLSYKTTNNVRANVFNKKNKQVRQLTTSVRKIPNFENEKGQPRRDLFISFETSPFLDSTSNRWIFYSMHNDGTMIHNLLAYHLLNSLNSKEKERDYRLVNIVFETEYCGIYLAVESSENYCFKNGIEGYEWEAMINKNALTQNADYSNNDSSIVLLNNVSKKENNLIFDEILTSLRKEIIDNSFDKKSFEIFISVNELMKDNSKQESDIKLFKANGKIYFDLFESYSLSSPSFKWYDYLPTGFVSYPKFISECEYLLNTLHDSITSNINYFCEKALNAFEQSDNIINSVSKSAETTWNLYENTNKFGINETMLSYKSRNDYINGFKEWLSKRIAWLSDL